MYRENGNPAASTRLWLIVNPAGGGFEDGVVDLVHQIAGHRGADIVRSTRFPEEPPPSAEDLRAETIDLLVVHGGDGTINAAAHAAAGWEGALLALPGGTMNLLSRRLHDDAPVEVILDRALAAKGATRPLTRIEAVNQGPPCAHVGIFAGPTTAWSEVREDIRYGNLAALVDDIPRALGETIRGTPVRLGNHRAEYRTIYIEPDRDRLHAIGFTTTGPLSLLEHARAWIRGDFRDGPHDDLGWHHELSLHSDDPLGLLVDGEPADSGPLLRLRAATSSVNFLFTRPS